MRTEIFMFLSVAIIFVIFLKTTEEKQEPSRPEPARPEMKQHQEQPKKDNSPIFEDDYQKAVANADRNVLVVFGADWCKYCKILKKDMPAMNLDGYVICVVDVTKNKALKNEKGVTSLPTSIVMNDGKEVARMVGYEFNQYEKWINSNRRLAK